MRDTKKRKMYDAARAEQGNNTGDYDPGVDDENLSVDDYKDDWKFAVEYFPELDKMLNDIANISPSLSIVFQSTILKHKNFDEADSIQEHLVGAFLKRFFGSSSEIQDFARTLLLNKELRAAKELNRAIKIFGTQIDPVPIISKIRDKHNLSQVGWLDTYRGSKFVETYKTYKIYQNSDGKYIIFSSPYIRARTSLSYSNLKTARDFIDFYCR